MRPRGGRRRAPEPSELAGMPPIASLRSNTGTLRHLPEEAAYVFTFGDAELRVDVSDETTSRGLLGIAGRVGDGEWLPLLAEVGVLFRESEGGVLAPVQAAERLKVTEFRHSARGRILTLRWTEQVDNRTLRRTLVLRIVGASVVLQVTAADTVGALNYCGFTLGPPATREAREVLVPYTCDPLVLVPPHGFFCAYPDRLLSNATLTPGGGALYHADTAGNIVPIDETFYFTLSRDPLDPLPALRREPSPHRDMLVNRVVLDLWSTERYRDDAERIATLRRYGLEDITLIVRDWQQFGYDRRPPCLYPANPERGTNADFRGFLAAAQERGWLVALREEYAAIGEDCSYWDDKAVAHGSDGQPRPGRRGGHAVAADKMIEFARLETTKIQRNYGPNAVFVDAHSAWNPAHPLRQVDLTAGNAGARTQAQAVAAAQTLIHFLRDIHDGPVLGAGGEGPHRFDTHLAGIVDGVERNLAHGEQAPVIPDYELREVRPLMVNFGVGAYPRFFTPGREADLDANAVSWDRYRATEIAFGHAGYLATGGLQTGGRPGWTPAGSMERAVSEYFLLKALQEQYLDAPVRAIRYRNGGELLTLADALHRGLDLAHAQISLEYGNGLLLWVNRSARDTWLVRHADDIYDLPPNGWLAANPRSQFLAYSALVAGNHADVCLSDRFQFLNTRSTTARRIAGITTDGLAVLLQGQVASRHDVVLVNARSVTREEESVRLSERGDVRLRHVSEREVDVAILDTESGKSIQVTLPAYTPNWRDGNIHVLEWSGTGWQPTNAQVQSTKLGPQLGRALPGVVYRLTVGS